MKDGIRLPLAAMACLLVAGLAHAGDAPAACGPHCAPAACAPARYPFLEWLFYRPAACGDCVGKRPVACCTPPLYTFFLSSCHGPTCRPACVGFHERLGMLRGDAATECSSAYHKSRVPHILNNARNGNWW